MTSQRHDDIAEVVHKYVDRLHGGSRAYHHDPQYHAQITQAISIFQMVDDAMQGENMTYTQRDRIIKTAVLGVTDTTAAAARIAAQIARVADISRFEGQVLRSEAFVKKQGKKP